MNILGFVGLTMVAVGSMLLFDVDWRIGVGVGLWVTGYYIYTEFVRDDSQ